MQMPAVIDLVEVGAGGGSIIRIDGGGALVVGPESAGASPGPACYGRGGTHPTVTDASVVLGYVSPTAIAGGEVPIHIDRARDALNIHVASKLNLSVEDAAYAAVQVAAATMLRALRAVSSERGRDPRTHVVAAFGGNGPLFGPILAQQLGATHVLIPPNPGVFSAVGLLQAGFERDTIASLHGLLSQLDPLRIDNVLQRLRHQVQSELTAAGFSATQSATELRFSLRYAGQTDALIVTLPETPAITAATLTQAAQAFGEEHERTYGHRADATEPVRTHRHPRRRQRLLPAPHFATRARNRAGQGPHPPRLFRPLNRLDRNPHPPPRRPHHPTTRPVVDRRSRLHLPRPPRRVRRTRSTWQPPSPHQIKGPLPLREGGWGRGAARRKKALLFLKKKKQKNFNDRLRPWWHHLATRGEARDKSFLVLFFKKNILPFFPQNLTPAQSVPSFPQGMRKRMSHAAPPMPGPTSHSYFSQRLRLHYVDWGNAGAPPLLLLHGGRDHCRNWDWVAAALRNDYHIIAPDLRGHGDSEWSSDGTYTPAAYVYDLAQLIHQQKLAPVTIIAHSLGGSIAVRYTGIFPQTVHKLIAIEGLAPLPQIVKAQQQGSVADRLQRWVENRRTLAGKTVRRYATLEDAVRRMQEANTILTPEQARHLTQHGVNQNEDGTYSWKFDRYVRALQIPDITRAELEELWSNIICPTLLVYGTESWATNPEKDGRLKHFKNARVAEIAGAGHWVHHDKLQAFLTTTRNFLKETS